MNTLKGNMLIAEFMGFSKTFVKNSKGIPYDYTLPNNYELIKETETTIESVWCEVLMEQDHCMISDLKFHTSWDWLIPVIAEIHCLNINYGEEGFEYIETINDKLSEFVINSVHEPVVEFIQWYNENK